MQAPGLNPSGIGILSTDGHVLLRQALESSHVPQAFGGEIAHGINLLGHRVVLGGLSQVGLDKGHIPVDVGMLRDVIDRTVETVRELGARIHLES